MKQRADSLHGATISRMNARIFHIISFLCVDVFLIFSVGNRLRMTHTISVINEKEGISSWNSRGTFSCTGRHGTPISCYHVNVPCREIACDIIAVHNISPCGGMPKKHHEGTVYRESPPAFPMRRRRATGSPPVITNEVCHDRILSIHGVDEVFSHSALLDLDRRDITDNPQGELCVKS